MGGLINVRVEEMILPPMYLGVVWQFRLYLYQSLQQIDLHVIGMFGGQTSGGTLKYFPKHIELRNGTEIMNGNRYASAGKVIQQALRLKTPESLSYRRPANT